MNWPAAVKIFNFVVFVVLQKNLLVKAIRLAQKVANRRVNENSTIKTPSIMSNESNEYNFKKHQK